MTGYFRLSIVVAVIIDFLVTLFFVHAGFQDSLGFDVIGAILFTLGQGLGVWLLLQVIVWIVDGFIES